MLDCVPKTPVLPVKKRETNYLIGVKIILFNFMICPVFIDTKQTLHYKVAIE